MKPAEALSMLQIQPHLFSSNLSPSFFLCWLSPCSSPPLTAPQPDRLPVLLQLGNQPVTLLDHVRVLLVLVVRPVRLDDLVDAVDGAGYAVCGYEFGQVPGERNGVSLWVMGRGERKKERKKERR